jgi:hypothetical protein
MTPQLAARYMGSGSADLACFALQLYAQRRRSAARLARWLDTAYCDGLSPLVHRRSTLENLPSISVMHRALPALLSSLTLSSTAATVAALGVSTLERHHIQVWAVPLSEAQVNMSARWVTQERGDAV